MPELPEVETIRRDLNHYIRGKTIKAVVVKHSKLVYPSSVEFCKRLVNQKVKDVKRRAKMLIFELKNGQFLLVHLKMTGQLIYRKDNIKEGEKDLPNKYSYVIFTFSDKSQLFYNDQMRFGWLKLLDKDALCEEFSKLGPEPLEDSFTKDVLFKILNANPRKKIKPFLMEQDKIAGLGNIYATEVCFYAKVLPDRRIKSLTDKEKERLFLGIKQILSKAIDKRGSSVDTYVDASGKVGSYVPYLKVYGRDGKKCKTCDSPIQKARLAGRGTYFCRRCQI